MLHILLPCSLFTFSRLWESTAVFLARRYVSCWIAFPNLLYSTSATLCNGHCFALRRMAARGSVRLVTTFFFVCVFYDKERAVLFMKDFTTFTAPLERDFQLVLVTALCSVLKEFLSILVLCGGLAPFGTDVG